MNDQRSYCLISPCRDESEHLMRTVNSVAGQTERPVTWIVVDDGSTDATPQLLADAARELSWMRVVRREDRGGRKVGPGVVDAFYAGYRHVLDLDWRYVCKLDMDLELPREYFSTLMDRMQEDARLGSTSGQPYYRDDASGELVSEGISPEMSVGASKFYRRRCFEQIGGLVRGVMWDGIDCHRARMLGWRTKNFDEAHTRFLHLRPMGSSQQGIWTGRVRHGYGQYFMGTGLAYITASSLYRMTRPPRLIGGLGMWWGYVQSAFRRRPRLEDPAFRRFVRGFQWKALLRGKRRATAAVEREQALVWEPDRVTGWETTLHEATAPSQG